jgi:hypothetical protein
MFYHFLARKFIYMVRHDFLTNALLGRDGGGALFLDLHGNILQCSWIITRISDASCFHITPAIQHFQIAGIFHHGNGGTTNSDGGTLLNMFTLPIHGHGKINLIGHHLLSLPCQTIARIPSARAPPSLSWPSPHSSPPRQCRRHHCNTKQVVGKRIPHNAVVDHLPHDLTPPPTQAGEDATGVHHAPTNATKLFGYGAAIAAPGSGDSPGRGLDLPAQILGLGLPRGVGSNNGG